MVSKNDTLPGRDSPVFLPLKHHFNGMQIQPPWPKNFLRVVLGMGCFWGAEKIFWNTNGVYVTSVGYSGGFTLNPTYEEVCSGLTGHAECVEIIYNPKILSYEKILKIFFESHNPTQGMQQGNDLGTQYRSIIFYKNQEEQNQSVIFTETYQSLLDKKELGKITTEIIPITNYFYAEDYHQQYLSKVPNGYCGLKGTGIEFN